MGNSKIDLSAFSQIFSKNAVELTKHVSIVSHGWLIENATIYAERKHKNMYYELCVSVSFSYAIWLVLMKKLNDIISTNSSIVQLKHKINVIYKGLFAMNFEYSASEHIKRLYFICIISPIAPHINDMLKKVRCITSVKYHVQSLNRTQISNIILIF